MKEGKIDVLAANRAFDAIEKDFDKEMSRLEASGSKEMSPAAIQSLEGMRGLAMLLAKTGPPLDPNMSNEERSLNLIRAMGLEPVNAENQSQSQPQNPEPSS